MRISVAGAASFIGFHVSKKLLESGHEVFGYDCINDYNDPKNRHLRLNILKEYDNFSLIRVFLEDADQLSRNYNQFGPDHIAQLVARAGVRYSVEKSSAYITTYLAGFQCLVELVKFSKPINMEYALSSSVYGGIKEHRFIETMGVNQPISLCTGTKLSNDLGIKSYGHLFGIHTAGLRFFVAYGPYMRLDMALLLFAKARMNDRPQNIFDNGEMYRTFTYIDDIASGVIVALNKPRIGQIYNLGCGAKEKLMDYVNEFEMALAKKLSIILCQWRSMKLLPPVVIFLTLNQLLGYDPLKNTSTGVKLFADWYLNLSTIG
jgi:UDP-glucuronate 4-epimerase